MSAIKGSTKVEGADGGGGDADSTILWVGIGSEGALLHKVEGAPDVATLATMVS